VHDRRATELPANASVCVVDVDDPYRPEEKISVVISLRDDVLARWRAQRLIDQAQFIAGRHWQRTYEAAQISPVKSIDFEKPVIDHGRMTERVTPKQLQAAAVLADAARALGRDGALLVQHILGHEMSVAQAALIRGLNGAREQAYVARRLREALECLARTFGYA
jgi:hypothetical protein